MSASQKVLLIGLSCGGSLPSALFDLAHMTEHVLTRMQVDSKDIWLIVESEYDKDHVIHLLQNEPFFNGEHTAKNLTVPLPIIQVITRRDEFLTTVQQIMTQWQQEAMLSLSTKSLDILLILSTHGYCTHHSIASLSSCAERTGCDQNIQLNGQIIIDDDLHAAIVGPLQSEKIHLLCLIDTCHSGTMLDLPYWTIDLKQQTVDGKVDPCCKSSIYSISACSDTESSMDDISCFGFDGGLIAAYLDSWEQKDKSDTSQKSIKELYMKIRDRLRKANQTSILSCNSALVL